MQGTQFCIRHQESRQPSGIILQNAGAHFLRERGTSDGFVLFQGDQDAYLAKHGKQDGADLDLSFWSALLECRVCDCVVGEEVFIVRGTQYRVPSVEFVAKDACREGKHKRGGLEDGQPRECTAGIEWSSCEELQLGDGQSLKTPADLLFKAFGRGGGAGLEGIGGENMVFGGGPVAVVEETVRNNACQFRS